MSEREAAVARARTEAPDVSEALARQVAAMADEKLGEDIVVLDMRELVSYTDFLVLVTARNERLSKAIADDVQLQLKGEGLLPSRAEGLPEGRWVLLDYLDCVLHVFVPETREHYRLEQLWGDVPSRKYAPGEPALPASVA
jgi:ribosome-associated protein